MQDEFAVSRPTKTLSLMRLVLLLFANILPYHGKCHVYIEIHTMGKGKIQTQQVKRR